MESNFVPYQQALVLKELGFNEKSLAYWFNETPLNPEGQCLVYYRKPYDNVGITSGIIREYGWAPLYQQAFRFFREKHNLCGEVYTVNMGAIDYTFQIRDLYSEDVKHNNFEAYTGGYIGTFLIYEEAEQACLDKLIEICKNKQNVSKN